MIPNGKPERPILGFRYSEKMVVSLMKFCSSDNKYYEQLQHIKNPYCRVELMQYHVRKHLREAWAGNKLRLSLSEDSNLQAFKSTVILF